METKTNKMKFGSREYKKQTPDKMRKLGDALLAASTMVSVFAISEEMRYLALFSVLVGAFGKFLTNFFTDDYKDELKKFRKNEKTCD